MQLLKLPQAMPQTRLPQHIWDLLNWNEEALVTDAVTQPTANHPLPTGPYHVIDPDDVWLGANVNLSPGCVLDASKGPILVGDGVSIGANSVITGPCYIGSFSVIFPLTHIRPGTSIGQGCRIGGEVGNSIIMSYTNKQHYGYLGDSYVGEWVNLGAGTTTSNLKNTFGEVSIPMGGEEVKTGRRLLGSMIGDHTKTAIGTRLNTGTYAGYCSMIGCSHIAPRYIKSLQWLTDEGTEPYRPEKAAEVIKMVLSRRHRPWCELEQGIFDYATTTAKTIEI
jgi:UDP-N-acetylglucosamine diphosphorylase/glucosamine-1-phosphate N-acetyltransferase